MKEKLLVIDPHPDDESYYFGGAISKFADEGADIYLLVLTNGEKGKIAVRTGRNIETHPVSSNETQWVIEHRQQDCRKAAEILGIKHVEFAGIPDMGINGNAISVITDAIKRYDPHVILTFDETGTSYHPTKTDHSATGISANIAVRNLLNEIYGSSFNSNQTSLSFLPPFSLRRLITYAPPNVERRLDNWGAFIDDPDNIINVEIDECDLWKQLKASASHKTQHHLTNFFYRKAGVVGLNPVPFAERICLGPRAAKTGNIFFGIKDEPKEIYFPPFPESSAHYLSNSAVIFEDIKQRSARAISELQFAV